MQVLLIFFFACTVANTDCEMTLRFGQPRIIETSKGCEAFLDAIPADPRIYADPVLIPQGMFPRVACIDLNRGQFT